MNRRRPRSALVRLASLDLRRRPAHASELRSQLLMGEVVRVLGISRDRRWWRVENLEDGYSGWVRNWGLVAVSARRAAAWQRRARARVTVAYAEARAATKPDALVSPLVWNCRVIAGPIRGRSRRVELPDGRRGWVRSRALRSGSSRPPEMMARVRSLLGVPYLWGGRTPLGLDCSSFTQQVLAEQGIRLPRDADQQFRATRPVPNGEPGRPGDLLFFGPRRGPLTHVGLCLGAGYYAHARGEVLINSSIASNPLWDSGLDRQFRGLRRPSGRHRKG